MNADKQDPIHDVSTGTTHGVPAGAAEDTSKGVPDSGRHVSETAPVHENGGKDQAKDI